MYAEKFPMFEITEEEAEALRKVRDYVSPYGFYLCIRIKPLYPHLKSLISKIEAALGECRTLGDWLFSEHETDFISKPLWQLPEVEAEHRRRWIDALLAQHEETE